MNTVSFQRLRDEMRPFLVRHDGLAYAAVALDFCVYIGATFLAVIVLPVWLKALLAVVAGTMISTLFVLGHDAAHGGLTSKRWANRALGRLVFLPSLHNYTLWLIQHNRLHHQLPNVRRMNSWWPLTVEEYNAMPAWRRLLERIYRGGGTGLYYLIERWWKDKFYPGHDVDPNLRRAALWDFGLLAVWLVALLGALMWVSDLWGEGSPLEAVFWGFVLPFTIWNCNMGLTVFLQHTHPDVPWFRTEEEARSYAGQEELTIHVEFPRWYGLLSHDIMDHPAHHINPMIPFYQLHRAQARLNEVLGHDAVVESIGFRYLRSLMRRCKLYDYDRREWLDFSGRRTGQTEADLVSGKVTV